MSKWKFARWEIFAVVILRESWYQNHAKNLWPLQVKYSNKIFNITAWQRDYKKFLIKPKPLLHASKYLHWIAHKETKQTSTFRAKVLRREVCFVFLRWLVWTTLRPSFLIILIGYTRTGNNRSRFCHIKKRLCNVHAKFRQEWITVDRNKIQVGFDLQIEDKIWVKFFSK